MIRLPSLPKSRAPLLDLERQGGAWLGAVIAALCFLACLAAVGTLAADRAAGGWARALGVEATVQVRPAANETGPAAAARAAETLAGLDGVVEASVLDRDAAEDLLRPWTGEAVLADLPIPHLVAVRLDPDAPASAVTLSRALAEAGIDAGVDDHAQWRAEVERSAALLTVLAGAAFLLTAGALAAAIVHATGAALAAQSGPIEILSLTGAGDDRLAAVFARRFALLTVKGAAAGALAAVLPVGLLIALGGGGGMTRALPVVWSDLAVLIGLPVLAVALAGACAHLSVRAHLGGRAARG